MPTKVAVVTEIDIQIRRSLSQLWVHVFWFFSFLFHGAELCGRKRMRRWRVREKKKVEGFFLFQVVLHMLCHLGRRGGVVAR